MDYYYSRNGGVYLDINFQMVFIEEYNGFTIAQKRYLYFYVAEYPASAFISVEVARRSIDNMLRRQDENEFNNEKIFEQC